MMLLRLHDFMAVCWLCPQRCTHLLLIARCDVSPILHSSTD